MALSFLRQDRVPRSTKLFLAKTLSVASVASVLYIVYLGSMVGTISAFQRQRLVPTPCYRMHLCCLCNKVKAALGRLCASCIIIIEEYLEEFADSQDDFSETETDFESSSVHDSENDEKGPNILHPRGSRHARLSQ